MNKKLIIYMIMIVTLGVSGCKKEGISTKLNDGISDNAKEGISYEISESTDYLGDNRETETSENIRKYVYICGEVNNPGVYEVEDDARLFELLNMAGGYTDNAATYLNLAETLYDGEKIYVLSKKEYEESDIKAEESQSIIDSIKNNYTQDQNNGEKNQSDENTNPSNEGIININIADAYELTNLPGIGESKALAIISYREENGNFKEIADIKKVSGIGESIYEKIKSLITV